ncbi:MAG: insulinase family protein [Proteobacteria bacterium]|nr:insulinase family protein [Pseudomonadota bacterium]
MSVRVTTLTSGLRVATDPMDQVETVALGVWAGAGTRHEPAEVNGVAHMLEHMAFKGTRRRTARQIAEEIESVGGHLNAYTSREHTAYYAKVLHGDVPLALDILADILQHSVFDAEELERERQVILQEIGQVNDTPDDVIFDRFQEVAFPGQALGRSVLGEAARVRALSREAVRAYLDQHYGPSRLVISAAGRIAHEPFVELAARAFDQLPVDRATAGDPAKYVGGEVREARPLEQVHMVLGFAGVAYAHPDFYAGLVLSTLLGGGMSSRLFQEVRERRGLCYSIYTFSSSYMDNGVFGLYAGTGEEEVRDLVPVVCEELQKAAAEVGEEEVIRARAQLKASILMSLESTSARCEQLARQLHVYGRPVPVEETIANIDAIDAGTVTAVARRLFRTAPAFAALGLIANLEPLERIAARLA